MANLDSSPLSSFSNWREVELGSDTVDIVTQGDRTFACLERLNGVDAWDNGISRKVSVQGRLNHIVYFDTRVSTSVSRQMVILRDAIWENSSSPWQDQPALYNEDGSWFVWNGVSKVGAGIAITADAWYKGKAEIQSDGTIDFYVRLEGVMAWTLVGSTTVVSTFDALLTPMFLTPVNKSQVKFDFDNYFWTDNGSIEPFLTTSGTLQFDDFSADSGLWDDVTGQGTVTLVGGVKEVDITGTNGYDTTGTMTKFPVRSKPSRVWKATVLITVSGRIILGVTTAAAGVLDQSLTYGINIDTVADEVRTIDGGAFGTSIGIPSVGVAYEVTFVPKQDGSMDVFIDGGIFSDALVGNITGLSFNNGVDVRFALNVRRTGSGVIQLDDYSLTGLVEGSLRIDTLDISDCDSFAGWSQETSAGSQSIAQRGSRTVIRHTSTANAWDGCGVFRTTGQLGSAGIEVWWDYYVLGSGGKDFQFLLRVNGSSIDQANNAGLWHKGVNTFTVWDGMDVGGAGGSVPTILDTWFNCRAVIQANGIVRFYVKPEWETDWILVGESTVANTADYAASTFFSASNVFTITIPDFDIDNFRIVQVSQIAGNWPAGVDGALSVPSGTTQIYASDVKDYASINVANGATLEILGAGEVACIGVSGNAVIDGAITYQSDGVPGAYGKETPNGESVLYSVLQKAGGSGGAGGVVTGGTAGTGGAGSAISGGGGGGGGGVGQHGGVRVDGGDGGDGNGSNGVAGDNSGPSSIGGAAGLGDLTVTIGGTGQTAFASNGGDGGDGTGGGGGGGVRTAGGSVTGAAGGGGGGGNRGRHGGGVFLKVIGDVSGAVTGLVDLTGDVGFVGGDGGAAFGANGDANTGGGGSGGGGGGAGGSGGKLFLRFGSRTQDFVVDADKGLGGAGGVNGALVGNESSPGIAGTAGTVGNKGNALILEDGFEFLDFSDGDDLVDWSFSPGGGGDFFITDDSFQIFITGRTPFLITPAGLERDIAITGADTHQMRWSFQARTLDNDFYMVVRDSAGNDFTGMPSLHFTNGDDTLRVRDGEGGTVGSSVVLSLFTWYDIRVIVNTNGTLEFSYRLRDAFDPDVWSVLGTVTVANTYNAIGSALRFAVHLPVNIGTETIGIDDYMYLTEVTPTTGASESLPTNDSNLMTISSLLNMNQSETLTTNDSNLMQVFKTVVTGASESLPTIDSVKTGGIFNREFTESLETIDEVKFLSPFSLPIGVPVILENNWNQSIFIPQVAALLIQEPFDAGPVNNFLPDPTSGSNGSIPAATSPWPTGGGNDVFSSDKNTTLLYLDDPLVDVADSEVRFEFVLRSPLTNGNGDVGAILRYDDVTREYYLFNVIPQLSGGSSTFYILYYFNGATFTSIAIGRDFDNPLAPDTIYELRARAKGENLSLLIDGDLKIGMGVNQELVGAGLPGFSSNLIISGAPNTNAHLQAEIDNLEVYVIP